MQAVILAAGKGKRLQPFTLNRSKAMAPVVGKPMVARVLDTILEAGIKDIVIVVTVEDYEIVGYFTLKYKDKANIKFALQKERLGMANALDSAREFIKEDFVLSACDSLISTEYVKKMIGEYEKTKSKVVLALMKVDKDKIAKTAIVEFDSDKRVKNIIEKPKVEEAPTNVSSLPLYIFTKDIFNYLPKIKLSSRNEYELQDAIKLLINDFGPISGVFTDFRLDLTKPDDLLGVNLMFLKKMEHAPILSRVPTSTKIVNPVYIEKDVTIGENCTIGPNVYIEENVTIENGAKIDNTVVFLGTKVSANSTISKAMLL